MKRVEIFAVGRLKEPALCELCADYYRRCGRWLSLRDRELKDERALLAALPKRALVVALDERGEAHDSRALARKLSRWLAAAAGPLVFVIGGADGLGPKLRQRADHLLSLSPLTFSHRLARAILAEQLYRAVSINEGLPYHRD